MDNMYASDSQTQPAQLLVAPQQNVTIKGNYILGKKIGEGSYGRVFKAKHLPTGQGAAVKIIAKANMNPKTQIQIKNELNILKKIKHKHIVQLYEVLETQKSLLLFTQHMGGGQLFHRILKQKKLSEFQACAYFQQMISAVDYLHQNKIAHGDIKPQNILLDSDRQIKLIDFGLSSSFKRTGTLTQCSGSLSYAAPQKIIGSSAYDPTKSDIWSCGVVLYVMLCGHLPFLDANASKVQNKIIRCQYKQLPRTLSASARNLIQSILIAEPKSRLTIEDIKRHEWVQLVQPEPMYGVGLDQKLGLDINIYSAHKNILQVSQQDLARWLLSKEKNQHTATYNLLIRKLANQGQVIPSYIGSSNFDPGLILMDEEEQHLLIPEPDDIRATYAEDGPNVGCAEFGQPSYKQLTFAEIAVLTCKILDKAQKMNEPNPLQILLGVEEVNKIQRKMLQIKEEQFYANNKTIGKAKLDLRRLVKHQEVPSRSIRGSGRSVYSNMYRISMRKSKGQMSDLPIVKRSKQLTEYTSSEKIARLKNLYGAVLAPRQRMVSYGGKLPKQHCGLRKAQVSNTRKYERVDPK